MSTLLQAIRARAAGTPDLPALRAGAQQLSYRALVDAIDAASRQLAARRPRLLALALENSPAWVVLDLAALSLGIPMVPVPDFFSATQRAHVLRDARADWLVCDAPETYAALASAPPLEFSVAGRTLFFLPLATQTPARLPAHTAKITYTSGTTGNPKGVCLSAQAQHSVAASLAAACRLAPGDRHLSLLPLSTLLENIGGVYAPLLAGACCVLEPLSALGSVVAGRFDAGKVGMALARVQATTTILVPQMLEALCGALEGEGEAGAPAWPGLRWVAVGGARVAPRLLQRATAVGLPVYEGYGLSECASVVALNTPAAYRAGSVGKPLPHVRLSFGADGEIFVGGATLLGYVGDDTPAPETWPSGDLGHLDADGFLHLQGRKKNLLITSFGRNISPEWVESELCAEAAIAQAVVFGDGQPWPVALLVPRRSGLVDTDTYADIARAVHQVNAGLPEYARIGDWMLAEPFTFANGQATSNGRPRRDLIWNQYQQQIASLYEETPDHVLP